MANLAAVFSESGGSTALSGVDRTAKLNEIESVAVEDTRRTQANRKSKPDPSDTNISRRSCKTHSPSFFSRKYQREATW